MQKFPHLDILHLNNYKATDGEDVDEEDNQQLELQQVSVKNNMLAYWILCL